MVFRTYMPLDIADGKPGQAVRVLRDKPGVVMADLLEGPPDVIVVVEASERQKLAKAAPAIGAELEKCKASDSERV